MRWPCRPQVILAVSVGALLGVFLLHPATMAVYWLEFRGNLDQVWSSGWAFVADRTIASFTLEMAPMTGSFAVLGALVGSIFAALGARFERSEQTISYLQRELAGELPSLIRSGEDDTLEFKSTARWDLHQNRVNRAVSDAVARTIAAFANSSGGSLLIGVGDDGAIVGLDLDYQTLRKRDRDGFTQFIMSLVSERLGRHCCTLIRLYFAEVNRHDVCRVIIGPSQAPIYFQDGSEARFFIRTGNATRELDAREVIQYAISRWGKRRLIA